MAAEGKAPAESVSIFTTSFFYVPTLDTIVVTLGYYKMNALKVKQT
jgi:hypothetical protein